MIELLNQGDVSQIMNPALKEYATYSFERLPSDFIYPDYGYFVIIEHFDELLQNPLPFSKCKLPSFNEGLLDYIELVEQKKDVLEVVILADNDFGVSLILESKIVPKEILDKLLHYQL
ncbi:MAG: hypothetical protein EOM50_16770 [Erysipelotrichia bacterium]|nr:hypothetical protein [Erysipelotrichia bacterium]